MPTNSLFGQVPEVEEIAQTIFAKLRTLNRPDPFLARELADGVSHFLTLEDGITSPAAIRELAVKVVRELGQPEVACLIELDSNESLSRQDISYHPVYSSNLIAAQDAGLVTLVDFQTPDKFIGGIVNPPRNHDWTKSIADARSWASKFVAFEAVEQSADAMGAGDCLRTICRGLDETELDGIINLNLAAMDVTTGRTLFDPRQPTLWDDADQDPNMRLLESATGFPSARIHWRWHLRAADFHPSSHARLQTVIALLDKLQRFCFCLDRIPSAVELAPGVSRKTPLVAHETELHLDKFRKFLSPSISAESYMQKLDGLIRLASSAGDCKRRYLRSHRSRFDGLYFDQWSQTLTIREHELVARHFQIDGARFRDSVVRKLRDAQLDDLVHYRFSVIDPVNASIDVDLQKNGNVEPAEIPVNDRTAPDQIVSLLSRLWQTTGAKIVNICRLH